MSKANREKQYKKNKDNKINHLLSPALKREFEGESPEELAAREEKEKKIAEKKLAEDDVINMDEEKQTKILKDQGIEKIPKTEAGRVKRIMKLQ